MNTEELLIQKNIKYTKKGADFVVRCLNPEHEDNNPSMHIDILTGKFNCLSCGYGGNIFSLFNVQTNRVDVLAYSIKQKIAKLQQSGLVIPLGAESLREPFRGISIETFNKFKAFTYQGKIEGTDVQNHIIFPIFDINGDVIYFQARKMHSDVKPKYLNIPKHRPKTLYPAIPEPINGSIILVEGLFDFLNLYDKGLKNAVASMGTLRPKKRSKDNSTLLEYFSNYRIQGVSTIYIMYDGDKAGRDAAKALLPALQERYIADIIELPEGMDPGSMTTAQVKALRKQLYENSSDR